MRRTDDVFFFTLIDLLLQVFFFGLLLYVVSTAQARRDDVGRRSVEKELLNAAGVSNLTELTDQLSRLAPISALKGMNDFVSHNGGLETVKRQVDMVSRAGGRDTVQARLDRLEKIEAGYGLPPCLYALKGGQKIPKVLATVEATDTSLQFQAVTPELRKVLELLGTEFDSIRVLPLGEFRRTFSRLTELRPDCKYSLRFLDYSPLSYARDAAGPIFRLNIERYYATPK